MLLEKLAFASFATLKRRLWWIYKSNRNKQTYSRSFLRRRVPPADFPASTVATSAKSMEAKIRWWNNIMLYSSSTCAS